MLAAPVVIATACTANYMEINTNPYEPGEDQMQADGYIISATMSSLAGTVISTDVNTAQFTDCLMGGPLGGYFSDSNSAWKNSISNYNPTDDWTGVFLASDKILPTLYSNLRELQKVTDDPVVLSIATIIKVAAMHRVTDTYGPIPYSQVGVNGQLQVPYDSQEAVYDKFFEELDDAIRVLTENRMSSLPASVDYIYGGNVEKWVRFANSLKLRLAMRIVYANRNTAQTMAEAAVSHEIGVIETNADNARMTSFGEKGNPIYTAVKYNEMTSSDHPDKQNCKTGGDTHAAADIIAYMNGYDDPRREKYFIASEWTTSENTPIDYVGLRRGIVIPEQAVTHKYSGVKLELTSPVYWMNAAEVAFLRAEARAIFGFDMKGEAKDFYEQGVRLSFEQWGAGSADQYLTDSESVPQIYSDPYGKNSYNEMISKITIAWNEGDSPAVKQERIITQKWIANWMLGNEAWADWRRTGYPRLIPATAEGNKSGGKVDSKFGARRMPYPQQEFTTNNANVQAALNTWLKGNNSMSARIWWDCNPDVK